jgi:uncharacterized protein YcaQ
MAGTRPTLEDLRRYAVARSLFEPTTLPRALARLGFVQADPIRAPARAQDLTLRHRVHGYRAGDLESRYPRLAVEEDFFVNYGFLPRETYQLMHPRVPRTRLSPSRRAKAAAILEFVRERGVVHPREVDERFRHGRTKNWFGGSSLASTQLLDLMHYHGQLRVARREGGIRLYAPSAASGDRAAGADPEACFDGLVDVVVNKYAPLPERSLAELVLRLRYGVPQWAHLRTVVLARTKARLPQATIDGQRWYWAPGEDPASRRHSRAAEALGVRLLAPFDPVVWDRRRFELLWGWAYRFEAYTPPAKRVRGYYALPLLWRDRAIGWGNLALKESGALTADIGFVAGCAPNEAGFASALDEELERVRGFLQARE